MAEGRIPKNPSGYSQSIDKALQEATPIDMPQQFRKHVLDRYFNGHFKGPEDVLYQLRVARLTNPGVTFPTNWEGDILREIGFNFEPGADDFSVKPIEVPTADDITPKGQFRPLDDVELTPLAKRNVMTREVSMLI